jgi:hypothetical protein
MINLTEGAGAVVAGEVRDAFAAVDQALLSSARMCASVIEATKGAGIPAGQSQRLLRSITSGMNRVVDGREEIVEALRQMNVIKDRSNLAPVSYGCPTGWEELAVLPSSASARSSENA